MIPTTENLQAWTLHQPYASGIALGDPGHAPGAWKDIENRPQRRTIPEGGRWYGLHAGLVWSEPDRPSAWHRRLRLEAVERAGRDQRPRDPNTSTLPHPLRPTLPKGAMLGVFHVTACVRYPGRAAGPALLEETDPHKLHGNDAAFGPWCYLIDQVRLLPKPVPCRGMQGSWPVAKTVGLELAQSLVALAVSDGR